MPHLGGKGGRLGLGFEVIVRKPRVCGPAAGKSATLPIPRNKQQQQQQQQQQHTNGWRLQLEAGQSRRDPPPPSSVATGWRGGPAVNSQRIVADLEEVRLACTSLTACDQPGRDQLPDRDGQRRQVFGCVVVVCCLLFVASFLKPNGGGDRRWRLQGPAGRLGQERTAAAAVREPAGSAPRGRILLL